MRVALICDVQTQGGSGVAATRLATGLVEQGCALTYIAAWPDGRQYPWTTSRVWASDRPIFQLARQLLPPAARAFDRNRVQYWLRKILDEFRPDVINVHTIHGAANYLGNASWHLDFVDIALRHAPVVWTLHDMWYVTGGCTYSFSCRKFVSGCEGGCPAEDELLTVPRTSVANAWKAKHRFISKAANLVAVAPSKWLAAEARAGIWRERRVDVIPYGLPLNSYAPVDRMVARKALGLPESGPILLAAATNLSFLRKGGRLLAEALAKVRTRPLTVITLGTTPLREDVAGINTIHLGYLDNERLKALAYSSADLFVHPAPVDNLPNVVLEAMACGVPVAAFPVGGLLDLVRSGATGWLAGEVSGNALAVSIDEALADTAELRRKGSTSREVCLAEYGLEIQAKRYLELFQELQPAKGSAGRHVCEL